MAAEPIENMGAFLIDREKEVYIAAAARYLGITKPKLRYMADKGYLYCRKDPFGLRIFLVSELDRAKKRLLAT